MHSHPSSALKFLRDDADEEVRAFAMYVITLHNPDSPIIVKHIDDRHCDVRMHVAKFLPQTLLHRMMNDADARVRLVVARRIDRETALLMSGIDPDEEVRRVALENALGSL